MPLTKIECDHASCPAGRSNIRFSDEKGMYLEVTAAGGKYWRMKYRHGGKEKRLAPGAYPDVSLAQARDGMGAARKLLASGTDPMAQRASSALGMCRKKSRVE